MILSIVADRVIDIGMSTDPKNDKMTRHRRINQYRSDEINGLVLAHLTCAKNDYLPRYLARASRYT